MSKKVNPMLSVLFTYSNLYSMARQIANSMLTDLDSFAEYGITEANIQYIFDLAEQLITTYSDKSLRIDISEALDEKTSKRERVAVSMRSIALRSKAVFGASSAKARVLNAGNISQIRDAELELTARKLHADASAELDALSAEGLTQAYLDKFEADINAFAAAAEKVKYASNERQLTAEKRQAIGAELYSLISKYCGYGKGIFANKSSAHYKRYVLNKSKKHAETEPDEDAAGENELDKNEAIANSMEEISK